MRTFHRLRLLDLVFTPTLVSCPLLYLLPCRNHGRPIIKHTTEIEYEGIEPSSTPHVLDARFSQANVFYGGPGGSRTRFQNTFLVASYNHIFNYTIILYLCQPVLGILYKLQPKV